MAKKTRQPTSIEFAVRLYYTTYELKNSDIKKLFGVTSSASLARLKDQAREEMAKQGLIPATSFSVHTQAAYIAWGLDIDDLENRMKKLRKLGITA